MEWSLTPLFFWICDGMDNLVTVGYAACATCAYYVPGSMGLGGLGLGTAVAGASAGADWNQYRYTYRDSPPPYRYRDQGPGEPRLVFPPVGVPYDEWKTEWDRYRVGQARKRREIEEVDEGFEGFEERKLINPQSQNM